MLVFSENPIDNPVEVKGSRAFYSPDLIALELTHQCPNRCRHCFLNAGIGEEMK
ncbi:MAG: hypothetical protein LBS28_04920 [Streptococcaceae bacterium]|jgi:MoaA/NifB/PqqE/SkfB family radical SAM enzyme|nr:hypothetical protein [Streptococcaceae bacterium]